MSNEIEQSIKQEIRVLTLLDELAIALRDNPALQDKVSERMAASNTGKELRAVVLTNRQLQPYYNEDYALALKPYLDRLIEIDCAKPVEFPRSAFPGISLQTIYLRVYQSWQWLRDNHEDKHKYIALYDRCEIIKRMQIGVRIMSKKRAAVLMGGIEIDTTLEHLTKLQSAITDALRVPQTIPFAIVFEKSKLSLTEDDQNAIKDGLAGVEGLTVAVTANSIKIARRISQA